MLPLVPGYLSTVIGVTPADLKEGVGARRVLIPSLLFIASFSAIFIMLGLSATVIGAGLKEHKEALQQIGGVAIIAMGVIFLATPFVVAAQPRVALREPPASGGPRRAARGGRGVCDRLDALHEHHARRDPHAGRGVELAAHGALLLAFYSLGLAIPFLLIALAFERMTSALAIVKRHFPVIIGVGGAVMIVLGVLILTGEFTILDNARASKQLPLRQLREESI